MESFYDQIFRKLPSLPEEFQTRAQTELNETKDKRDECLTQIRELIKSDNNIEACFPTEDDDHLLKFLRSKKFDVERTFELIKSHVKFKRKYPEVSEDLTFESVRECLLNGFPGILPERDAQGCIVLLFSIGNWDRNKFPNDVVLRSYLFLLDYLLLNEETQLNGITIVENFRDYSLLQALTTRPSDMKKMVESIQGTFPSRFKGAHFIYQPWFFTHTVRLIRPFLKTKLASRVFLYGYDLEPFWRCFKPSLIPVDLGGKGPCYDPKPMVDALAKAVAEREQITQKKSAD
ncbi:retinaldehyde-binding protein 1-like [Octopus sinensis]|uniref:Retinaldehyde-binding protein 1-like n=1 Tax=Octopus sinensis TaxID=2607531 RepID=A0A6P7T4X9_9MOLL|nr:retinaldehyde-binding protein 1-like [Octopus sinensis]XP_029645823.1 retinaldehyde-binding protein 1-like [Octopus sinensis]